jgi:integrase
MSPEAGSVTIHAMTMLAAPRDLIRETQNRLLTGLHWWRVDTRTIQAYLGHKSIQHTVRYTEMAPTRFKRLFRD